jgi:CspA family cold shock protein
MSTTANKSQGKTGGGDVEKGLVKWFDAQKGYGFVFLEGNTESIFVHQKSIKVDGYRTLEKDAEVEFEIESTPKGLQAINVVPKTAK